MKTTRITNATFAKSVSLLKSSTALPEMSYVFELKFTLNNPNTYDGGSYAANDKFATAISTSGNYTIVGSQDEGDAIGTMSGVAYIYSNSTGQLLYTLRNPNPFGTSTNDFFGQAVAISNNYAIVGASESDANGTASGKAYIYSTSTGQLIYTLDNPNPVDTSQSDRFGQAVAISDSYVIVGANGEDDAGLNSGKAYVFSLATGQLVYQLDNVNATGTTASDLFGISVGITDTYAIVGAHQEDVGGSSSGSAYIFSMSDGSLQYTLNNPNAYGTSASDFFGRSVAISNNYAIVGAYGEDDANGTTSGKAYIYSLSNGSLLYTLNNPNPVGTSANDNFGYYIDVSDTHAVISAHTEGTSVGGGAIATTAGKAYVYNLSSGSLVYTIDDPNAFSTATADNFSQFAVSISNDYVSVGAWNEDSSNAAGTTINATGRAYIFSASNGTLLHTLTNPNAFGSGSFDEFSRYNGVSVSSMYTVIGAANEDSDGVMDAGKAYIYSNSTGQLLYTLNNPITVSPGYIAFGTSVANTNDYVAVGSPYGYVHVFNTQGQFLHTITNPIASLTSFGDDIDIEGTNLIVGSYGATDGGRAYIYNVETGSLLYTLINPNAFDTAANDNFGYSVGISNNYAIVGASLEDDANGTTSGKAYVYSTTTGQLLYTLDNPNPVGTSTNDGFGTSVAISNNYAIVGAYGESDAGGTSSGKAYIYSTTTGQLLYTLDNPTPYGTSASDYFGRSVSISNNYAIVGAVFEDDANGLSSGKAYVYSTTTGQLLYTLDNPNPVGTSQNDNFGQSVEISGNYAIFSAYGEDESNGLNSGKAYLYTLP
jgi:hypothetical protein